MTIAHVVVLSGILGNIGAMGSAAPPESKPRALDVQQRITPEGLRHSVEMLVSFGTRHTMSDATSETRGVGAARRWIREELASIEPKGRLEVFDETFDTPKGPRIDVPTELVNVIAVLPGRMPEATNRRYYVVGHYDSRASDQMDRGVDAPGANDNASGVAVVIECARALASERLDATVVFLATPGEEQGLLGAHYRASQAKADGEDVRAVLNNDIVGGPMGERGLIRVFSEGIPRNAGAEELARIRGLSAESDGGSRQLARYIEEVAKIESCAVRPMMVFRPDRFLRGGDHSAFNERGFSAVRFTVVHENYDLQHQDVRVEGERRFGDTSDHVDAAYLADVARLNAAALLHLANAPSTPADVRIMTAQLERATTLRWSASPEPDVAGYEVVWRDTTEPRWTDSADVGNVTQITLPLNKDNVFIGVRAYDSEGYRSPVGFAGAARE